MSCAPPSSPSPQKTEFTSRRGFRRGKWLVAVPAHLTMAVSVLVGCASEIVPLDLVAAALPQPPASMAAPSPSPSPSGAEPTAVSASPTPEADVPSSEALEALENLPVAARGSMAGYDREAKFGDWIDADGDCANTRDEVLHRDLTGTSSANGCTVVSGFLDDPYTGRTIRFTRGVATSSDVQIDHVVSAGNAWVSGAPGLLPSEREEFYNDPLNLLAVDGPTNGTKSDSPADEWLPPEESFHCEYVATQIAVKAQYDLSVTASEKEAMIDVLSECPGQELPTGMPFGALPGGSTVQAPAPGQGTTSPALSGSYRDCDEAWDAGAAPLSSRSPGYAPALDGDGDGVACEG